MENENEQSNEPVESTETTESNEPSTLADVATKFNVEQQASEFQTQSAPEPTEPLVEDNYSYDPEIQKVTSTINNLTKELSDMKQQATDDRLNRDIKETVKDITNQVDVEPLVAEIFMEKKYRDDPSFKTIWDARYANPDALKAATKIVANEISKAFDKPVEPQLAENVRAAKKSQSTTATAPAEQSKTEEMMNLNDADFDRAMQDVIHRRH